MSSLVRFRRRCRRGGTLVLSTIGLTSTFILLGMQVDGGRMVITRHKDQVIADACTLAAAQELPYRTKADAAIARVVAQYRTLYNTTFTYAAVYTGPATAPTKVRVTVTEDVPMFVPTIMKVPTREVQASAAITVYTPT